MFDDLWHNLHRTTTVITKHFNSKLKSCHNLTVTQYSLLKTIQENQKRQSRLNELSGILGVDRTTLCRNIKLLIARRLVFEQLTGDRRTSVYHLTGVGEELLCEAGKTYKKITEDLQDLIKKNSMQSLNPHQLSSSLSELYSCSYEL